MRRNLKDKSQELYDAYNTNMNGALAGLCEDSAQETLLTVLFTFMYLRDKWILQDKYSQDDLRLQTLIEAIHELDSYLRAAVQQCQLQQQDKPSSDKAEQLKQLLSAQNLHLAAFWDILKDNFESWFT